MSKLFIKKRILFFLFPVFIGLAIFTYFKILPLKNIEAGAGQNVTGFAWSSNLGWISFNSNNCDADDSGFSNAVPAGCPSVITPISNYGVHITDNGATGIFSGYAWSSNVGWINFNPADLSSCPTAPSCQQASVDKITGQVSGWAKILNTNDWLRLRGNGCNVSISKGTGDFYGWAWGGETIGWVSFNCNQAETGSICPSANYKIHTSFDLNIKPTVTLGSAPNPSAVNLCSNPAYSFAWVFNDLDTGDTQSQYQLQVDKEGTFASFGPGEVDLTVPAVADSGDAQTKEVLLARNPGGGFLDYNSTNYKWRIKVWDNWGGASPWVNGSNFISPAHVYPSPNFTWNPQTIIKDQLIQFCSIKQTGVCDVEVSTCYGASYPSCSGAAFTWSLPPNAEFAESTTASTPNPVIKFTTSGKNQSVSLKIQDDAGFCVASKNVNVILPLPKWQEILPQ